MSGLSTILDNDCHDDIDEEQFKGPYWLKSLFLILLLEESIQTPWISKSLGAYYQLDESFAANFIRWVCRDKNTMDTALYERAKRLLDEKLAEHRKWRRLENVRSMEDANVPDILRREAFAQKQGSQQGQKQRPAKSQTPHTAARPAGKTGMPSKIRSLLWGFVPVTCQPRNWGSSALQHHHVVHCFPPFGNRCTKSGVQLSCSVPSKDAVCFLKVEGLMKSFEPKCDDE